MELENARRAYEAAKRMQFRGEGNLGHAMDATLLLTLATAAYETDLLADAQAKLDAMGVVIGETVVCDIMPNKAPYVIDRLEAMPDCGTVRCHHKGGLADYDTIRPYVAPVVKEMVLYSGKACLIWGTNNAVFDHYRLTLSGITPVDLDAMKPGDVIEGSYKIERME